MPSLRKRNESSSTWHPRVWGDLEVPAPNPPSLGHVQRFDGGAPLARCHLHEVEVAGVELGVRGILILGIHLARAQRAVVLALKRSGGRSRASLLPRKGTLGTRPGRLALRPRTCLPVSLSPALRCQTLQLEGRLWGHHTVPSRGTGTRLLWSGAGQRQLSPSM